MHKLRGYCFAWTAVTCKHTRAHGGWTRVQKCRVSVPMMAARGAKPGQWRKVQESPYIRLSRRMFDMFLTVCHPSAKHVRCRGSASEAPRVALRKIGRRIGLQICWLSEADRFNSAAGVRKTSADLDANASARNIRQRLHELQFRGAGRTPRVSASDQLASLAFAKEDIAWTPRRWSTVIVNDESTRDRLESHRDADARMGEEVRMNRVKPAAKDGGG